MKTTNAIAARTGKRAIPLFPLVAYLSKLEHLKPYLTVTAQET
jgi:hypothetical protein